MNNPTSKQVRKVVETLKSVLPMATREDHLAMWHGRVNTTPQLCGTIHCHGGWYAIACGLHKKAEISFADGADQMAKDLGLGTHHVNIIHWAKYNPEIWGNWDGNTVFQNEIAFYEENKRPMGARNLQDIIDHWSEVADRLEAIEQAEQIKHPSREDITKELVINKIEERLDVVNELVMV